MPILNTADEATRSSYLAVLLCVVGAVLGIGLGYAIDAYTIHGYLPVSTFLATLFLLLTGYWLLSYDEETFDPSATFVTFILTLATSAWILRFFYIDPGLGPFSEEAWSVPMALTNAAFGITLFLLIGMVLGMTYHAARRTYGKFSAKRALWAFIGVGVPIYMLAQTEYFLTHFQL